MHDRFCNYSGHVVMWSPSLASNVFWLAYIVAAFVIV
jgi:hypothetical protein